MSCAEAAEDPRLARWLGEFLETPGLTAISDLAEARALHIEDALTAVPVLLPGTLVDVGSGGGSPGFPLAAALPSLVVTLLEANRKKSQFLERWAAEFQNVSVVRARAEEFATGPHFEQFDCATARALAPPAVALEWALPLVRVGGRFILFTTRPNEQLVADVAPLVGGELADTSGYDPASDRVLCVVEKTRPTPSRFPRRAGVARKRPLKPRTIDSSEPLADRDAP